MLQYTLAIGEIFFSVKLYLKDHGDSCKILCSQSMNMITLQEKHQSPTQKKRRDLEAR